jgi:WD40 repeat protein
MSKHFRYFVVMAWIAISTLSFTSSPAQEQNYADGYSFEEVIAAYEAGQFRVIHTRSVSLHASSDGSHVAASYDGVYRLSDGTVFPQYDKATFSPDSLYVAQENDGVYRLSDGHKMFAIGALPRFTPDGAYLAAEGYGVFRLRDGQKLFEIDDSDAYSDGYVYSFYSHFSPNGNYVVIDKDGVYRLSDRQKLFEVASEGLNVTFSPDERYVASAGDGVYRLSDGQKLFDIQSYASFDLNSAYVAVYGDAVYRLSDGQKIFATGTDGIWPEVSFNRQYMAIAYDAVYRVTNGNKLFDIPANATFSQDGEYVVAWEDGVYRLGDRQKLFDVTGISPTFSEDASFLAVSYDGFYRMNDGEKLFEIPYGADFSPDGNYVAVGTVGLYRLSDTQKVFDIEGVNTTFSHSGTHIMASSIGEDSVYRVSDGRRYRGLRMLNVAAGVIAVGNAILVVDPSQQGQRILFVQAQTNYLLSEPESQAASLSHINSDSLLAVVAQHGEWYQVSYNGITGWVPANMVTPYYVPQ